MRSHSQTLNYGTHAISPHDFAAHRPSSSQLLSLQLTVPDPPQVPHLTLSGAPMIRLGATTSTLRPGLALPRPIGCYPIPKPLTDSHSDQGDVTPCLASCLCRALTVDCARGPRPTAGAGGNTNSAPADHYASGMHSSKRTSGWFPHACLPAPRIALQHQECRMACPSQRPVT
ncbi:hypothetical protein BD310DRAFT_926250 [Dichomitus squalens]|uniref:Uncharacterized protein n=1 Tax=Dichomitus squalens TaxID=114155 RepID=A0A4Q9PWF3_9APHY|nr:hypothetical protein BD310DRAFT_926250 [Dichomitus squalens]